MATRTPPATTIIGAGRLARAFLPLLTEAGYPIVAVAARSRASARRACRDLPGVTATDDPVEAASGARLVLVATPDRAIREVAAALARGGDRPWRGTVVLHHAGSEGPALLQPLSRRGAAVGVLHPLQALGGSGAAVLPGSGARIEGDARAVATARRLARDVGLVPLSLRRRMRRADRAAYHAAASLVSNDLVSLLDLAAEVMVKSGVDRPSALAGLVSLASGTLRNLDEGGLESAITGPVSRGDAGTAATQARCLARHDREGAEIHRLLSRRLLRLAVRTGAVGEDERRELERVLSGRPDGPAV
jgi:predicted short-subunit dehydrogenase-like oxidoreductase (DUF2520 family)